MEFEILKTYIQPEVLVLIPVLYLIGLFLRQTPNIPDWIDVWVLLFISIIACFFLVGFNIDGFIQGVLVAGGAVLIKDVVNRTQEGIEATKQDRGK